ncbi:hypothetical protein TNCT_479511 [Trichonephila clavata]|uniref:Uncharacterized protein n=1 Tax=Trichonephila clavata TaxID=2740835 RepID=A0A8X6LUN4_TRICU|nr:hypothetical protein TNCT_479511 [Trichonephila clavata]
MWESIVGDSVLGAYILPPQLDSDKYLFFLQEVLPKLLTDVPATFRRRMWFQQDKAPSVVSVRCDYWTNIPNRWIEAVVLCDLPDSLIYLPWSFFSEVP